MALKQSHVNQLHKIIASAEKLITEIEREMQSQSGEGGGGRGGSGGRGRSSGGGRGRSAGKSQGRSTGGRSAGGRKAAGNGEKTSRGGGRTAASRNGGSRRNRAQTAEFRQSILKELEGGTPVADLAARHGITPAYVYQIKSRAES